MAFQGDSIFWVETEKVVPNPFQPRREFDQNKLQELSESIRMYGVLQPLTVTRKEVQREDGTFYSEYELIAGERRLRASRLAEVAQVPVIIREGEQSEQEKLELAIIENLQREDLNAIDRALAFQQLAEQFKLSHTEVAKKVQRSREYVSNSIRLLALPEHIQGALQRGELAEGHARTLLMLTDRPEEQETIFREILLKKMSVREVERIVRKIATDKVRKTNKHDIDEHLIEIEKEFTETLGTRVQILKTEFGGKLTIDYFSEDDLAEILHRMKSEAEAQSRPPVNEAPAAMAAVAAATPLVSEPVIQPNVSPGVAPQSPVDSAVPDSTVPVPTTPKDTPPSVPTTPEAGPQSEPVPSTQNTPPTNPAQPTPAQETTSAPDPSLLERLAAHTSFSFTRPAPEVVQPTAQPAEPVVEETQSEPSSEAVPPQSAVQPNQHEPTPDDQDLYSIRNFSV